MKILFSALIFIIFINISKQQTTKTIKKKTECPNSENPVQPVVCVISQPATTLSKIMPQSTELKSQVVASYTDWVRQAGAVAAIVPWDAPWDEMILLLSQCQVTVFPGGAAPLKMNYVMKTKSKAKEPEASPYMTRINLIINYIKEQNDSGKYHPLWATCLGFEELIIKFSGMHVDSLEDKFDDNNKEHSVELTPLYKNSKLKKMLSKEISFTKQKKVYSQPFVYYYHDEGMTVKQFNTYPHLVENLDILATSKTDKGLEFISIIEDKKYPIFATQFHPEKIFEHKLMYTKLSRNPLYVHMMNSYMTMMVNDKKVRSQAVS